MKKYAMCQYFNEFQRLNALAKITIIDYNSQCSKNIGKEEVL